MAEQYSTSTERERFLVDQYHILTHSIKAERFYTWLRSQGVFSMSDQEEVETKYPTTYLRAGHLIDTIRMKGQKGFVAFMQVLEWEFPDTFTDIIDREPTKPPKEFRPKRSIRRSNISDELMPRLVALIKELDDKMTTEQRILAQQENWMQQFKTKIREEEDKIQEERDSYENQVEILSNKLEQTLLECADKDERMAEKSQSEMELKSTIERLSAEKEALYNQIDMNLNMNRAKNESVQEMRHSQDVEIEQLRSENTQLKSRLDLLISQLVADKTWLDEMGKLRTQLTEMFDNNSKLRAQNTDLHNNMNISDAQCANLREKLELLQLMQGQLKSSNTKLEGQLLEREQELAKKKDTIKEYEFYMQNQQVEIDVLMKPIRNKTSQLDRTEILRRIKNEPVKMTLSWMMDKQLQINAIRRPRSSPCLDTCSNATKSEAADAACPHCLTRSESQTPTRQVAIRRPSVNSNESPSAGVPQ